MQIGPDQFLDAQDADQSGIARYARYRDVAARYRCSPAVFVAKARQSSGLAMVGLITFPTGHLLGQKNLHGPDHHLHIYICTRIQPFYCQRRSGTRRRRHQTWGLIAHKFQPAVQGRLAGYAAPDLRGTHRLVDMHLACSSAERKTFIRARGKARAAVSVVETFKSHFTHHTFFARLRYQSQGAWSGCPVLHRLCLEHSLHCTADT